jgi:predicted DNA binding protein
MSETTVRDDSRSVCEVEFNIRDPRYPFVGASEEEHCLCSLAEIFPRPDGQYAEFFTVTDADPVRIAARAAEYESVDVTLLRESENSGFFEFLVSEGCPAVTLAELGALPRTVLGEDGTGRIVAEIPPQRNASAVIEAFSDEYPEADLVTKREKDTLAPRFAQSAFQQVLHEHLTERQREVLQTAYEMGYYDWPRECTGADIAEKLDISSPTFSEHIKAAERNLFSVLLNGPESRHPGDQ